MKKLAYIYALLSVVLGPAILNYGENIYPHKLACFDEETSSRLVTMHQYKVTQLYETIPSLILIVIGAVLLTLLIRLLRKKKGNEGYALAIVLVAFMMFGYCLIIGLAALMTACVSS